MKTIKSLKDITTLEVGDIVVFGNLEYEVTQNSLKRYYLILSTLENDKIFNVLNINKQDFIDKLGIKIADGRFPETYSLEALTAIVTALFKEYEKQNEFPKTWEEFCEKNPIKTEECFIESSSDIYITRRIGCTRDINTGKNYCVSKQEAEAFLALMQLRQLRKAYVKNWESNWTKSSDKYCIDYWNDEIRIDKWVYRSHVLSFPTYELATKFLTNFRNLLEIAKPLL